MNVENAYAAACEDQRFVNDVDAREAFYAGARYALQQTRREELTGIFRLNEELLTFGLKTIKEKYSKDAS